MANNAIGTDEVALNSLTKYDLGSGSCTNAEVDMMYMHFDYSGGWDDGPDEEGYNGGLLDIYSAENSFW